MNEIRRRREKKALKFAVGGWCCLAKQKGFSVSVCLRVCLACLRRRPLALALARSRRFSPIIASDHATGTPRGQTERKKNNTNGKRTRDNNKKEKSRLQHLPSRLICLINGEERSTWSPAISNLGRAWPAADGRVSVSVMSEAASHVGGRDPASRMTRDSENPIKT